MKLVRIAATCALALTLIAPPVMAQKKSPKATPSPTPAAALAGVTTESFKALEFRNIGPANMGGRVDDFAVDESNPTTFYVGMASAGIMKTTNGGTTFETLFTDE